MFDNIPSNIEYCRNIVESVTGVLYYSHIPTAAIALLTGLLIYFRNKNNILTKILLMISLSFSIWSTLDLLIWFNFDNSPILMLAWSLIEIFSVLMFFLSIYFLYVFINKHDVKTYQKIASIILFLPVVILSFTNFHITGYDAQECIAIENPLMTNYVLGLKIFISMVMVGIIIRALKRSDLISKRKLAVLSFGILSFIFAFLISGFIANFTENYIFEMYGLMAMVVFIASLARLIVVYNEFNVKIFASQILVIGLIAAIAAQFAFIRNPINMLLNSLTVLISIILGWTLVKSVKREIDQREHIQKLAEDLETANKKLKELDQLKSEFLSLATHQIRAPLTAVKGYSSMLLEGDFGVLPQKATDSVKIIMKSCQNLINIVEDFLNISRIEQGRMVYNKSVFDVAELVKEVTSELSPNVQHAGLTLETEIPNNLLLKINADRNKIKQIIGNIVDNATKYTLHGNIKVSVFKEKEEVKVAVKDNGIGIDPSEINKLFTKFSRAKEANKANVIGTGLGLYIAKKMAEAHDGDIKIFSEGLGKGTTFTIELPLYFG